MFFGNGLIVVVVKKDLSGITFENLKYEFKKLAGKIN